MPSAQHIYSKLDAFTQVEIKHLALSSHFKLFLQAMKTDCNTQLVNLNCNEEEKLIASYKRITMTREIYDDLLNLLTKLTKEGDSQ